MNKFFNKLIHKFLWTLTCLFPWRVREVEINGNPYLRRFYIFKRQGRFFNFPFAVYLHYFYRGDEDRELHNHPWKKSKSLILTGGYTEFKKCYRVDPQDGLMKSVVLPKIYRCGDVNTIEKDDFHKIELRPHKYGKYTWTIFLSGDRISDYEERYDDWGFWDSITDTYIPQAEFEKYKSAREKLLRSN